MDLGVAIALAVLVGYPLVLFKNYAKQFLSLSFIFVFCLVFSFRALAFSTSQFVDTSTSSSALTSFMQELGVGDDTTLESFTIQVVNDSGSPVSINNTILVFAELDSSYKWTYPASKFQPVSISCVPADRCTGSPISAITSGTSPVLITGSFAGTQVFSTDHKYIGGYSGNGAGIRLKLLGSSSSVQEGLCYSDDSVNYTRYDDFGDHDFVYINTCPSVNDIYYSINGDVPDPTILVSGSESVNILENTVSVDLSGNLYLVDEGYIADIRIWQECTRSGYASYNSTTPVVHVSAVANDCRTESYKLSDGYYVASDYCDSPADTTWSVERVELPYPANFTCTYPVTYCIYEQTCEFISEYGGYYCGERTEVVCGDLDTIELVTDTGGTSANIPDEPDCTSNPLDIACRIAWLGWKIQHVLVSLFSFSNIDWGSFEYLKTEMSNRVPFAYGNAVFNMDMTSPVESGSSAVPTIAFTFVSGSEPSYTYTPDTSVTDTLGSIRSVFLTFLWLGLIVYIVLRIRSFKLSL